VTEPAVTVGDDNWLRHIDVIDAHQHFWRLSPNYPWLLETPVPERFAGDDRAIRRDYLPREYRRDFAAFRLVGSVHVEANPLDAWAEAQWVADLASGGLPSVIVAGIALESPEAAADLERIASIPQVRGVRQVLNLHPDARYGYADVDYMADARWRNGFRQLERLDLSFDLQIYPHQMQEAARLASAFPATTIVLNHAGMPIDRGPDAFNGWSAGLAALAARPNVVVKISGLGMIDHHWTVDSIRPYVLEVIERFGAERTMFGSNFPVDKVYSDGESLFEAYGEITRHFAPRERRLLFADTARAVYRM
jgi:predicted TIM-barrel fold metal-dependent hydrolase